MTTIAPRVFRARVHSTDTFGRVICDVRDQHYVVDGPVHNGWPGEAVTPAELFISGVAACGVELLGVLAQEQQVPLRAASVEIQSVNDPEHPVRRDVNLFNSIQLAFTLSGVSQEQGQTLIAAYKQR